MDEFFVVIDGVDYDISFFICQILVLFIFVVFYSLKYEKRLIDASNNIVLILIVINAFLHYGSFKLQIVICVKFILYGFLFI